MEFPASWTSLHPHPPEWSWGGFWPLTSRPTGTAYPSPQLRERTVGKDLAHSSSFPGVPHPLLRQEGQLGPLQNLPVQSLD